jgi:hypothetical protein
MENWQSYVPFYGTYTLYNELGKRKHFYYLLGLIVALYLFVFLVFNFDYYLQSHFAVAVLAELVLILIFVGFFAVRFTVGMELTKRFGVKDFIMCAFGFALPITEVFVMWILSNDARYVYSGEVYLEGGDTVLLNTDVDELIKSCDAANKHLEESWNKLDETVTEFMEDYKKLYQEVQEYRAREKAEKVEKEEAVNLVKDAIVEVAVAKDDEVVFPTLAEDSVLGEENNEAPKQPAEEEPAVENTVEEAKPDSRTEASEPETITMPAEEPDTMEEATEPEVVEHEA